MTPAHEEAHEPNNPTPPSITGTDSDASDPGEANGSEEPMTEEQKPIQKNDSIDGEQELSETAEDRHQDPPVTDVDAEEEKEEIKIEATPVDPQTDDHVVSTIAHGGIQSTSKMRSTTYNPDIDTTDTPCTGLPSHQQTLNDVQELPRGAAIREKDTDGLVESTESSAPTDEGSHHDLTEMSVTENTVRPQKFENELELDSAASTSLENIVGAQVACHPSKLTRDDSDSTLQPIPIHQTTPDMPPNVRPPSRVEEEPEEYYHPPPPSDFEKKQSTEDSFVAVPEDVDTSSTRNTSPLEQTESVMRIQVPAARSATETPASPHRTTPLADESVDTASIVVAPPGTIVFQQPNGEHAFLPPTLQQHGHYGYPIQMPVMQQGMQHTMMQPMQTQMMAPTPQPAAAPTLGGGGRRKITLRLEEDVKDSSKRSFFFRRRSRNNFDPQQSLEEHGIDRGTVTVSWFEGTSSVELQEHVRRSVVRKMNLESSTKLVDLRIMDQSVEPAEEIVLSPFIPDGSCFLLRFSTQASETRETLSGGIERRTSDFSAPQTPSAAPSPYPSNADLNRLNAQLLSGKLKALKPPLVPERRKSALKNKSVPAVEEKSDDDSEMMNDVQVKKVDEVDTASKSSDFHEDDVMGYNPEDQVDVRLRQIADLLIEDRKSRRPNSRARKEKRQVVFVIANYFVLFLSFIAISAELSARAPQWLGWVESQLQSVQKCSTDQDALFECVSKGDFAGLVASFILFLSRSAATKRFFLFGFETPKKLWTVVYESLVTAVCWGLSYIVIRRGMNPDTRVGFVRKYWKDAVYGSLAGFNAAFMKQVLKNLIPQDALEDAFQERQLKILSWLPSFH